MREIKFRGFFGGQMYYPDATQEYQNAIFHCFSEIAKTKKERAECAIMQYIGKKDKNKKEMYEGDIIDYGSGRYCPITYQENGFGIDFGGSHERTWLDLSLFEVVGNIYENPELTLFSVAKPVAR